MLNAFEVYVIGTISMFYIIKTFLLFVTNATDYRCVSYFFTVIAIHHKRFKHL